MNIPAGWVGTIGWALVATAYAPAAHKGGGNKNQAMEEVVVTEPDHGRVIEVALTSRLLVRLPESPSTGYRWELEPPVGDVLKLEADTYQPATSSVPGAGGIRVLEFDTGSDGIVLIRLRLRRPWETGDALRVFEVNVRVRTGSGLGR